MAPRVPSQYTNLVPIPQPGEITYTKTAITGGNEELLSVSSEIVRDALIDNFPWVMHSDMVGIEQYCRAEARARLIAGYIDEICDAKGPGAVPGYLWNAANNADNTAMKAATSLGLNPEGRLKIAKDAGFATHFAKPQIEAIANKGAEMRRRRSGTDTGTDTRTDNV